MFGPTYRTPAARMYRAAMMAHLLLCKECGTDVCGDYADGKEHCRYHHEYCAGGDTYADGVFCHYCR